MSYKFSWVHSNAFQSTVVEVSWKGIQTYHVTPTNTHSSNYISSHRSWYSGQVDSQCCSSFTFAEIRLLFFSFFHLYILTFITIEKLRTKANEALLRILLHVLPIEILLLGSNYLLDETCLTHIELLHLKQRQSQVLVHNSYLTRILSCN